MFQITGEWFNADPEAVVAQALQTGAGPNVSDAYTVNGLPGPTYNCSAKGINLTYLAELYTIKEKENILNTMKIILI